MTVAIDAMGGDNAPSTIVEGSVLAAKQGKVNILLVGDQDIVETELSKHNSENLPIRDIIMSEWWISK